MTQLYMLDTDIASYAVSRRSERVARRLAALPVEQVAVSAITYAEILYGLQRLPETHWLHARTDAFFESITILPWGPAAARDYAIIRDRLRRNGTPMGPVDTLIAAHAIAVEAILVTNNTSDFRRVGPPLMLENWHDG